MSLEHEKIQYLLKARSSYGESAPPFTQKHVAGAPRPLRVRLLDGTREVNDVRFRQYKTPLAELYYATIRLDGNAYIVKRLGREWKKGDSTLTQPNDRFWYVWQGPTCHFRGRQFNGPVARSMGASPDKRQPVVSISCGTRSSLPGDGSKVPADRINSLGESQSSGLSRSRPNPTNPHTRAEDPELEELSPEAFMTAVQAASEHGHGPHPLSRPPVPNNTLTPTLRGEEMDAISLDLARGHNTALDHVHMLLGEARPRDGSLLTVEALFEKITKVFPFRDKNLCFLQWAFVEGPVVQDTDQPKPEPTRKRWISREAQQSCDDFMSDLRQQIREHGVQGWHVRINVYSL